MRSHLAGLLTRAGLSPDQWKLWHGTRDDHGDDLSPGRLAYLVELCVEWHSWGAA